MLSRRTRRRSSTGRFHTAVCTVWPCHDRSCGSPTLTDISRPTAGSALTGPEAKRGGGHGIATDGQVSNGSSCRGGLRPPRHEEPLETCPSVAMPWPPPRLASGPVSADPAVGRLMSVNVGLPQDLSWHGQTVHTAVWKRPVEDRRLVRRLNIDGDGQGDLAGHGGENRAVFVYQLGSYQYWQRQLGRDDFTYGQFGENFTVQGLDDDQVCIGDRFRIGEALFEVSQPRVTCYRVGIRMNVTRMPAMLVSHHRPGFYLRVLQEGAVQAGDQVV